MNYKQSCAIKLCGSFAENAIETFTKLKKER